MEQVRSPAFGKTLTLILAAAVAGCGDVRAGLSDAGGGDSVCASIPAVRQEAATNAYQQAIQRDECIHRAAYALAAAPDTAESVVAAVIGACRAQIDRSATMLGEGDEQAERFYLAEMEKAARERAIYRVIQARAGRCS